MSESEAPAEPPASPSVCQAKLGGQLRPAVLSLLVLTVLTGCIFPLLLFTIARPLLPRQARGSMVRRGGAVIGSELIGQEFTQPGYFHPRPSAAGSGYDGTASGGTNLGPNNPKLIIGSADFAGVRQLAETYRRRNGLASDAVIPVDAVTRSASGLSWRFHAACCCRDSMPRLITNKEPSGSRSKFHPNHSFHFTSIASSIRPNSAARA